MKNSLRILGCAAALTAGGLLLAADTEPPVPVRTVPPAYPEAMRAANTSGVVVLVCEVDEKGSVTDAKVTKTTNEAFNQPAIDAVTKWKFRPAQKDGKPVAIHINLPVKFSVDN